MKWLFFFKFPLFSRYTFSSCFLFGSLPGPLQCLFQVASTSLLCNASLALENRPHKASLWPLVNPSRKDWADPFCFLLKFSIKVAGWLLVDRLAALARFVFVLENALSQGLHGFHAFHHLSHPAPFSVTFWIPFSGTFWIWPLTQGPQKMNSLKA